MDCRRARELAELYLDGALIDPDLQALRQHLQSCAGCQSYVVAAERVLRALPDALAGEAPPGMVDRIMAGVESHARRRRLRRRIMITLTAAGAAALLMAVLWPRSPTPPPATTDRPTLELVDRSVGWVVHGLDATCHTPERLLDQWLSGLDALPDGASGTWLVVPDTSPLEWAADAGRGLLQELDVLGSPAIEPFSFLSLPRKTDRKVRARPSAS